MVAAIIIAAGHTATSSHFLPLQPVGTLTAVERQIKTFAQAGVARTVVVGAGGDAALEKKMARSGAVLLALDATAWPDMLAGVKAGLRYLDGRYEKALITRVDVPLFSSDTVQRLLEARGEAVLPLYEGVQGHPVLLSAGAFESILAYEGPDGLAGALRALPTEPVRLALEDAGVVANIQRQEAAPDLVAGSSLHHLRPEMSLYLAREERFMGPGPFLLLSLIDETHSLRLACARMSLSYSKGLKMIDRMEAQLGRQVVVKKRGGSAKGASTLTEEGKELVRKYALLAEDCKSHMERAFGEIFGPEGFSL